MLPEERSVITFVNSFFFFLVTLPAAVSPTYNEDRELVYSTDMLWLRILAITGVVINLIIYGWLWIDKRSYHGRR